MWLFWGLEGYPWAVGGRYGKGLRIGGRENGPGPWGREEGWVEGWLGGPRRRR